MEQLDFLNGKKSLEGYSSRNTGNQVFRRQRDLDTSEHSSQTTNMARDKIAALGSLNKMALFMMKIVNKLMQARVAVIFVSFGTGTLNSITRKDGCLFNQIPTSLFNEKVQAFKPIQKAFDLPNLKSKSKAPTYLDALSENAALIFLTFAKQNGKVATKRPPDLFQDDSFNEKFTDQQKERYQCFSEQVDINSSWGDLVVITPDQELPIQNYLVHLEGSSHMISHYGHIGHLTSHVFNRPLFDRVSTTTIKELLFNQKLK